ncbi:Tat (Twin-arginine translocation) pathway signal sequence domain protein [Minicystis rosea]|nr:Tat (Twin-arginine translocation) pathway signal sequence domain protein [Minicystis rosea]
MSHLRRRALLRAIAAGAGGAMLLPILSRLTSAGPPKVARFLFIVEGNCYEPVSVLDPSTLAAINATTGQPITGERWWYNLYKHDQPIVVPATQFDKTTALPAIASLGLADQTAVLFGLSSRITGGGHSAFHGVLSSARTVGGAPGGQTIDSYLGALPAVRLETPYDVVRVGMVADVGASRLRYGTCAMGPGVAAPVIVDPLVAYATLFGLVASPEQMAAFAQRKTLLDFARQDLQTSLGAFGGSSAERQKLETYLASIEELGKRQQRLTMMAEKLATVKPPSPDTLPGYATDCMARFGAQLSLAVASLKGQLTNVAVVTSGTGDDFGSLTYPSEPNPSYRDLSRHDLHHASADDAGALTTIHDMTRQQLDAIAAAAQDLKNTPDPAGSGSMLDNTVIVFIGDNGEQHHSTASEFPVVLIGGKNLGLNTGGRTIVYPGVDTGGAGHRQVSNLWNTLGHLAGDALDTFGKEGPYRVAPGPLAELL